MERFIFKTSKGVEVELNENDMHAVHQHYMEQATADYLRENHEDWSEEKVQEIAIETHRQMLKYGFTEEDAIGEALEAYEKEYSDDQNVEEDIVSEENEISTPIHRRHRAR